MRNTHCLGRQAAAASVILWALAGFCPARAAGPQGVDAGWVIDNSGNQILTSAKCAAFSAAKVGWVRVELRLVNNNTAWNSTMLGYYDAVVNNARNAGLQVLILVDNTSWPGNQTDWCANNYEHTGGNGDNSYINGFAQNAVTPIVQHFQNRVHNYEIWNEPNAWTSQPSPGVFTGGTFLYPSNYSQMLANSYADLEYAGAKNGNTVIFGGVFGHSIGNVYSYGNAGAQYIDDTYNVGIGAAGSFSYTKSHWGTYPVDAVAQHIYIDSGGTTSSGEYGQYIAWVRQAYTKYEGTGTGKKSWITETGWSTASVSQSTQNTNLNTAFGVIEGGSYNYLTNAIWFNWQDGPGLSYGILDSSGNHKLCYPSFQFQEDYYGYYSDGTTNSNVANYENGRGQAVMGDPFDNGGSAFVHKWSSGNYWAYVQDCSGGSHLKLQVQDSGWGTFEVNDVHGFFDSYLSHGGIANDAAKNNEYASGSGTRQDFGSGHYITWDPTNGTVYH